MDNIYLVNALGLCVQLSVPILGAVLLGAIVASLFQAIIKIEDPVISYIGRLLGFVILCVVLRGYYSAQVIAFTKSLWGETQFYQ